MKNLQIATLFIILYANFGLTTPVQYSLDPKNQSDNLPLNNMHLRGGNTFTLCSNPNVNIPDNMVSGINNSINFNQNITVTDINITINSSHTWVGDLVFTLTNDGTGTTTTLIDRPGFPLTNFGCDSDNIVTTIDDTMGTAVEDECNPVPPAIGAGPFTPNNPLSVFYGENALNSWTLNASDLVDQDTGTLNEWCVVITGDPDVIVTANNLDQSVCIDPGPEAITPVVINMTAINNYNNPVTLAFNPILSVGISGGFSNNPTNPLASPGANSTLNLNINNMAAAGDTTITVDATGTGLVTKSIDLDLTVAYPIVSQPLTAMPTDGSTGVSLNTSLSWDAVLGIESYDIDIATDVNFSSIVESATSATNSFTPTSALLPAMIYYWRVRASNFCTTTAYELAAFETIDSGGTSASTTCSNPGLAIPDNDVNGLNDSLNIASGGTITDIDISLDVNHTWVGDLIANVSNVTTLTNVTVLDRPGVPASGFGCDRNNINTTIDDSVLNPIENECANPNPAIGTGPFSPNNPLSVFNGESSGGNWSINISDNAGGDLGALNQWCVIATISTGSSLNPADYSDLSSSYGVARHEGTGTTRLGSNWSADSTFSEDSDALDDDGISASGLWLPNSLTAQLSVESNGGFVACWFDWNNDGLFAISEKSVAQTVINGTSNISITVPLTSTFGNNGDDFLESRCRLYNSEPFFRATEISTGTASSGEVEDYRFPANQLTPVTMAFVESQLSHSGTSIEWTTSTETATVAFNILGNQYGVWKIINSQPIAAKGINSVIPYDYNFTTIYRNIELFKIVELTSMGTQLEYGPYLIDHTYGKKQEIQSIDWDKINRASNQLKMSRQQAIINNFDFIKINVNKTGIQRITYDYLLQLGVDWNGVDANEIAITNEGQVIPRKVSDDVFNTESYIDFIGLKTNNLYTNTNVYLLELNPKNVKKPIVVSNSFENIDDTTYHIATIGLTDDIKYSFASPTDDPWFNQTFLVYTNENSWDFELNPSHIINNGVDSMLHYYLWGGTDWPASIDHHVQVFINEQLISDEYANGVQSINRNISVKTLTLNDENTITFSLPADTGVDYDLIQLDKFTLNYPSEIYAINDNLDFNPIFSIENKDVIFNQGFEEYSAITGFNVKGFSTPEINAYGLNGSTMYDFDGINSAYENNSYTIQLPQVTGHNTKYYVATPEKLITPELILAQDHFIDLTQHYDYLVITHSDFKNSLTQLVDYHQSRGVKVLVVDIVDIYAQYSNHKVDAQSIKSFIKETELKTGINAVLLVGSDSYDYKNNLNINSTSFVPTLYYPTDSLIRFAPVDALFVDIDNDLIPNLAIGRLPVRTPQELQNTINKILAFDDRFYTNTAVFSSDRNAAFDSLSNQMVDLLPVNWSVDLAYINSVGINDAKSILLNNINSGVSFTSYFGHSGPSTWSFEHLFDTQDIQNLINDNKPTLINQFGCWNTYYVMPEFNTMAHQFMSLENKGAVAVMGASTLTLSNHEASLGHLLIPLLINENRTIGDSILDAKIQLAIQHPEYLDVILGWTLLGDPMLRLNQKKSVSNN